MRFKFLVYVLVVALATAAFVVCVAPATSQAQTLNDCETYISEGHWESAREACAIVLHDVLMIRQSQAGEYCDNCAHSLAEIPTESEQAQLAIASSRIEEDEAVISIHYHQYDIARYWLIQATRNSSMVATYNGSSAIVREYRGAAASLYQRERQELGYVSHFLPKANTTKRITRASPQPSAHPACANPNTDAMVSSAASVEYPDSARDAGLGPVTVLVQLDLSPSGAIEKASIYKSSGNDDIDVEALKAARASVYTPRVVNCKPVESHMLFRAEFNPD